MQQFTLTAADGLAVAAFEWPCAAPKAVVVIAHGMGEHAQRYDWVAEKLTQASYQVYAKDHRGHGLTIHANPGHMGEDGWNRTIEDIELLVQHARTTHPNLPVVLLGHSMGSMLSQQYITRFGTSIDAVVLSGSPGLRSKSASRILKVLATFAKWRNGEGEHSEFLQERLFGNANTNFEPARTGYEWLSRDEAQVDKYVADDLCGFVLSCGSLIDMANGGLQARSDDALGAIPKSLPVYIFAGEADPVHGEKEGIEALVTAYEEQKLADVTVKWYPEGRHEMFNEINRDEVVDDLLAWLGSRVTAAPQ